jgi:single-stranded DNA-binding protein
MAKSNTFTVATDVKVVSDATKRMAGEKELVSFTYADNSGNDKDETKFVTVTVSGKLAEVLSVLKKGDRVNVVGKETFNTYPKKDGSTGVGFKIDYPMSVTRVFTDQLQPVNDLPSKLPTDADLPPGSTPKKRGRPPGSKTVAVPWEDE